MTPVRTDTSPTFRSTTAPDPADTRLEEWSAVSLDGLWRYDKQDDTGTTWTVTYVPTGQTWERLPSLSQARRATASWLPDHLRAQALRLVLDAGLDELGRTMAQRWFGVWLRNALADGGELEPTALCRCGGILVDVGYQGGILRVHIDACQDCWPPGATGLRPVDGCAHRFCPNPAAA